MDEMRKIRVTLGLCKPDHTWEEKTVEFDAPEDFEERGTDLNFDGFDLNDQALFEYGSQFISKEGNDTVTNRVKKISNVIGIYSGSFVLHWEWVDEGSADEDDE